ncbi:hypothetical protein [Mangrovibacterium sp.]|uniref:hypothetical protein n=1 Tax=Mangrovibacterium sp. TaxID=1961364 RepID=UPI00356220FC
MKANYFKHIALAIVLGNTLLIASAQKENNQLQKEVEVVKAYQPTISDAYKINDIPKIDAPVSERPIFEYKIETQPMNSDFSLEPVQAAKMVAESGSPLNRGLLKLGAGNYFSQYGEFFYNTKAGRNSSIGLHLKSHLSNAKIKLENKDKVKAPDNEYLAELFTNHDLRSGILSTKIYFEQESFRYYGYTGEKLTDDEKAIYIPMWNEKQAFPKAGFSVTFDKKYDSRASLQWNSGLSYQYFSAKTGQNEHKAAWNGHFSAPINLMEGVLDAGITYTTVDSVYQTNSSESGDRTQFILKVNPAAVFDSEVLKFKLGINSYTVLKKDDDTDYMLAPNTRVEYRPSKDLLTLYAGTDGYLKSNNFSAIAEENHFIRPDQNLKNTKYRYILTGGVKGKFSPNFNYGLQVDYANIKNQYFYYLKNQIIGDAGVQNLYRDNTFDVLYDKMKQLTVGGELHYALNQEMNIRFQAKYHSYKLNEQEEAYLKPDFESTLSFFFDPEGPVRFSADFYSIGKRKALTETTETSTSSTTPANTSLEISELDAIFDLNVGLDYQFNSQLSFWSRANNLSFKKHELYPGYTQQGFNVLVGASLSF